MHAVFNKYPFYTLCNNRTCSRCLCEIRIPMMTIIPSISRQYANENTDMVNVNLHVINIYDNDSTY